MLRNTGIRSKILAVLALPVLVLVLAAAVISTGAISDAGRASRVEVLVQATPELTKLVRGLQAERALTAAVVAGDSSRAEQLRQVRAAVTGGVETLEQKIASVDLDAADAASREAVLQAQQANERVEGLRAGVDGGSMTPELATQGYTEIITADIEVAGLVGAGQADAELNASLRSYSAVERLVELVTVERDLVLPAVVAGSMSPELRAQILGIVAQQEVARGEAVTLARDVSVGIPEVVANDLDLARAKTVGDADGALSGIDAAAWTAAAQAEIDQLTAVENQLAQAAAGRTDVLTSEAQEYAWRISAITVLLVVLPVLLALFISRLITRPLRRLTEAATQLREQLPAMVEQMHTPGEAPSIELPEIPVAADDEIGRLAAAFNDVNATTVQVAQEQAALRGSIAAMFVNVARRDQVLLSRQLAFIDQLERTEENPKTLENLFKLDHLATRMRRNAESLLVLAGIDTGRRLRRPMPLSDVVRTASSEIEHYDRVDLVLQTDPPMVGHVALTASHLLAELLENATNFSDPGSRVVVSTAPGPTGVVVTIADDGLGMTPDEIREANSRIAEPPIAEVVGAQRLGFFVVGRLARRLDAKVTLTAGRARGTIVRIDLPAGLFAPGAVVELPSGDVAPADQADAVPPVRQGKAAQPVPPAPRAAPPAVPKVPIARSGEPASPGRSPVPPVPAAAQDGDTDAAPEPPVLRPANDDALPKRQRPPAEAPVEPVADAEPTPAQAGVPAPGGDASQDGGRGSGLFGSFRARQPGATAAVATTPARPVAAPAPPVPSGAPVPPARVAAARPASPAAPSGAAALDILPIRKGAKAQPRLFGRRNDAPSATTAAPVAPMTRRELGGLEEGTAVRPAPAPRPAPVAPAPAVPARAPAPAPVAGIPVRGAPSQPVAAMAPLPVRGGATGLPTRTAPAAAAASVAVPVVEGMADVLRQRSALASEALTELSRLSAYSPATVDTKPPATLSRRTPAATPAAEVAPPKPPAANRRARNAADVRSMLSGFQAGVERGRTTAEPSEPAGLTPPAHTADPTPTTTDTPRPTGGQA